MTSAVNAPLNNDLKTIQSTGITAADGTMSPRRNLPVTIAHITRRISVSVVTTVHL